MLGDDSAVVVLASLTFPVEVLQRILSPPTLHSRLVRILQNHILRENADSKWSSVIPRVISALTETDAGDPLQEAESMIAILIHMLLKKESLKLVLKSSFGHQNSFMKAIKTGEFYVSYLSLNS